MLTAFDLLRLSKTGAELLSTLRLLPKIEMSLHNMSMGVPYSAMYGPCKRCWIYARSPQLNLCESCNAIESLSKDIYEHIKNSVIIWAYITEPLTLLTNNFINPNETLAYHNVDDEHLLIITKKASIKDWLQNLALAYGDEIRGLIQIFPTMGQGPTIGMADILNRAAHQEKIITHDRLWIRFFPKPWQLVEAKKRDDLGILTFSINEFIDVMETTRVFHDLIPFKQRHLLYEILNEPESSNNPFYWGRFTRSLNQASRDMLDAWGMREWAVPKVQLLYDLLDYVHTKRNY
jgi:hypothetical protein